MAQNKVTLQVRVKKQTLEEIKKVAELKDETTSEYVRKLLETHLISR